MAEVAIGSAVPGQARGECSAAVAAVADVPGDDGGLGGGAELDADCGQVPGDVGGAGEEGIVAVVGGVELDPAIASESPFASQHAAIERDERTLGGRVGVERLQGVGG